MQKTTQEPVVVTPILTKTQEDAERMAVCQQC